MDAKEFLENKGIRHTVDISWATLEDLLNEFLTANRPEFEPGEEVEVSDYENQGWICVRFVGKLDGYYVIIDEDAEFRIYKFIRKINPTRNAAIEEIKSIAEKNNIKIEIKE